MRAILISKAEIFEVYWVEIKSRTRSPPAAFQAICSFLLCCHHDGRHFLLKVISSMPRYHTHQSGLCCQRRQMQVSYLWLSRQLPPTSAIEIFINSNRQHSLSNTGPLFSALRDGGWALSFMTGFFCFGTISSKEKYELRTDMTWNKTSKIIHRITQKLRILLLPLKCAHSLWWWVRTYVVPDSLY